MLKDIWLLIIYISSFNTGSIQTTYIVTNLSCVGIIHFHINYLMWLMLLRTNTNRSWWVSDQYWCSPEEAQFNFSMGSHELYMILKIWINLYQKPFNICCYGGNNYLYTKAQKLVWLKLKMFLSLNNTLFKSGVQKVSRQGSQFASWS